MRISSEEFKKISHLARLEFSSEEEESLKASLGDFVGYLDKIKNLNTKNIKPMMRVDENLKELRTDSVKKGLKQKEALKNAPESSLGHFTIPKIVKTEN